MSRRRDRAPKEPVLFDLPLTPPPADPPSPTEQEVGTPALETDSAEAFADEPLAEPSSQGVEPTLAPLGRRALSGGADILLHAGALASLALGLYAMGIEPRLSHWPALALFILAFSFLYTVVSLAFWGQTAGMAWFGLAARESPQFPPSFVQASKRWAGGLLTLALAGLPILLALRGASLSDLLSGTRTYKGYSRTD